MTRVALDPPFFYPGNSAMHEYLKKNKISVTNFTPWINLAKENIKMAARGDDGLAFEFNSISNNLATWKIPLN